MSDGQVNDPRFDEDEVQEILRDASEPAPEPAGLALSELKEIGEEAGISPDRVEQAALTALAARDADLGVRTSSTLLRVERAVHGALPKGMTAEALAIIRNTLGDQGTVQEVAGALEWSSTSEVVGRHVSVSLDQPQTTIRVRANLKSAAALTALPIGMIGILLPGVVAVGDGPLTGAIIFGILAPIISLIGWSTFRKIRKAEEEKLEEVSEALARLVAGARQ